MKYSSLFLAKLFLTLIFLLTAFFLSPHQVRAETSGSSASFTGKESELLIIPVKKEDRRVRILQKFLLSHNSPLADYAETFVSEADKNSIDWKMLPAIAGVESTFGVNIPANSYNGWGFGIYGSNTRRFSSWNEAIATIAKALHEDYMTKWGATNIYAIGRIYAADPFWAGKVAHFMDQIDASTVTDADQNQTLSISL